MKTGTVHYLVKDEGGGYKPHAYFVMISTSAEIEHLSEHGIASAIPLNEDTPPLSPPHKLIKSNSEDEIVEFLLDKLRNLDNEHDIKKEYVSFLLPSV